MSVRPTDLSLFITRLLVMQPSYRDGDVIPVDFNPPVTPFDLSRQNLGTNTEGESAWQGWESLLVRPSNLCSCSRQQLGLTLPSRVPLDPRRAWATSRTS